jgi:hypothetical protein
MLRALPILLLISIAPVPIQVPTSQPANDTKNLRVRMLDSRSGKQIKDDPFFVLVDHITDRTNIFVPTYPETEAVLVPSTVSVISARAPMGMTGPT